MKEHHSAQCSQTVWRIPSALLVGIALGSGLSPGREFGSADSIAANAAGKAAEPARAEDRLSPATFGDSPVRARPGAFRNWLDGDSLRPESTRFTRSNLDRIQNDPTSDSSYGRVPGGKTRPVYTKIPPLMKSGLFGPVRIITPRN